MASPLWRRLVGFTLVPAIAAVSPLLVLPVVSRLAGPSGWASAMAGESVGTMASIAIAYGWTSIGPALVAIAHDDRERGRVYRASLIVRLLICAIALPIMAAVCWLIAAPGSEWLSVLMGLQGAMIALTFTWFSAGVGDPRSIVVYDSLPRLLTAAAAALAIASLGFVELYPLSGIAVTLVGTGLFTLRVLRKHPAPWPRRAELRRLFRSGAPVALNDAVLGGYSTVPTPLVIVTASPADAAGFASADKMLKLGQILPITLANALQAWIAEVHGAHRRTRLRNSLLAHGFFGVLGCLVLAILGAPVSLLLFGDDAQATTPVLIALGISFALFSVRTAMTRLVLFPAGHAHAVMRATLVGTAVGLPVMVVLALVIGPVGAAIGYALTEACATVLLVRKTRESMRTLSEQRPI